MMNSILVALFIFITTISVLYTIISLIAKLSLEYLKKYLYKKVRQYCENNLTKISLVPSYGYYNFMCHWNSYNRALLDANEDLEVVACVCVDDICSFSHIINYSKSENYYYDFTLGTSSLFRYDTYLVKHYDINFNDVVNMDDYLIELKYYLIDKSIQNKLLRKLYYKLEDKFTII